MSAAAPSKSGYLPVDLSTMRDRDDLDLLCRIVDEIENAVVTDANPVGGLPLQFLDTERSRILFEREQLGRDASDQGATEGVEFFFGGVFEENLVAHDERRADRSAR